MRRSASALISSSKPMDSPSKTSKSPLRVAASSSSTLALPFLPQLPPRSSSGRLGCFCTAFLLAICFTVYLFSFSRGFHFSTQFGSFKNRGYMIIIDAGSSGSRVHVFHYIDDGPLPLVSFSGTQGLSLKTKPGLSAFAKEPQNAGQSLEELLIFAASKVPKSERSDARIYLMATAGLRRLEIAIQDSILESCRATLRTSGFTFYDDWASVITGTDEGVFAWIAANYALGSLGRNIEDTVGIIELGGASAQITFVPDMPPPLEYLRTFDLGGVTYPLYTHSFLHLGQFFGLLPKAALMDIQNAGQHFCEEDWTNLQGKHKGIPEADLLRYCFSSAYIVALLHDSLGLAMSDDRVMFANQVGKMAIDWALGALIVKVKEEGSARTSGDMFQDYKAIFSFVLASLIVGLGVTAFYWWRRPSFKTIYDLEKGRYITTVVQNLNRF